MIAEALKFLFQSTQARELKINELSYSDKPLTLIAPPTNSVIEVEMLSAVEELVKLGVDGCEEESLLVHVVDFQTVEVKGITSDRFGRRPLYVKAEPSERCQFSFGRYMDPETFIIGLQTAFVESSKLKDLIVLASSLTAENVALAEDDGISQKATVRQGVALKTTRKVEPKVSLKPYRTFREVEQPASDFLFRLKNVGENQPPHCALFEADGGAWKIEAAANVAKWFKGKLVNVVS